MTSHAPIKLPPLFRRPVVTRLLVIALLAEIGYAVLNISTMPVYLSAERGFGASLIAVVVVAFLLSEAIFKSAMGHLADRYGCRTFMIVGPAITLFTSLATLFLPKDIGMWETLALIGLRILDGVGAAMLWPAAFAEMGHSVRDHERQQAMSLLNMCYLLGIALALPVGGIAEDLSASPAAGLYLAAGLFLSVVVAAWFGVSRENVREGAGEAGEHEGFKLIELVQSFRSIPVYIMLAVVTFAGIGFPMVIIKLFALDEFRLSASAFGALVFPGAIAMAAFSVPMGRLGERLGPHRAVHYGLGLCAVGLIFVSAGAFVPMLRTAWALALGGIPIGMGFLLAIPAWMTSVSDLDPRRRAANVGAIMTAQGLGAIVGAPIGGLLYEKLVPVGERMGLGQSFGHYSPFLGCAACVTFGWLLSLRVLKADHEAVGRVDESALEAVGIELVEAPMTGMTEHEFITLALAGRREEVLAALDDDPRLADAKDEGIPVTTKATYYGHGELAREIASRKGAIDLFEAAVLGDERGVVSALESSPATLNSHSADGFTALGFAAFFGHHAIVDLLLERGADPNTASCNPLGVIPLHSAMANRHWEIAKTLVEAGSDVNASSAEGWTPLHYAAAEGSDELTQILLAKGADPRAQRHDGVTPAQAALEQGHQRIAELLERQ